MSKLSQTKIQVLDQFEVRTDEWSFGVFEKTLEQAMGARYGNYQTAKSTSAEADRAGLEARRQMMLNPLFHLTCAKSRAGR